MADAGLACERGRALRGEQMESEESKSEVGTSPPGLLRIQGDGGTWTCCGSGVGASL